MGILSALAATLVCTAIHSTDEIQSIEIEKVDEGNYRVSAEYLSHGPFTHLVNVKSLELYQVLLPSPDEREVGYRMLTLKGGNWIVSHYQTHMGVFDKLINCVGNLEIEK